MAAVQDCLHLLGALRGTMAILAEASALDVSEQLLKLFALGQPLLSQHAARCLVQLVQGTANTKSIAPAKLQLLLKVRHLPATAIPTRFDEIRSFGNLTIRIVHRQRFHK